MTEETKKNYLAQIRALEAKNAGLQKIVSDSMERDRNQKEEMRLKDERAADLVSAFELIEAMLPSGEPHRAPYPALKPIYHSWCEKAVLIASRVAGLREWLGSAEAKRKETERKAGNALREFERVEKECEVLWLSRREWRAKAKALRGELRKLKKEHGID